MRRNLHMALASRPKAVLLLLRLGMRVPSQRRSAPPARPVLRPVPMPKSGSTPC